VRARQKPSTISRKVVLPILLVGLGTFGCNGPSTDQPVPERNSPETPEPADNDSKQSAMMQTLLARAAADPDDRQGLQLEVSCGLAPNSRQARISSRGVVVWHQSRQLRLPPESMDRILEALVDQNFMALEERYGTPAAAPVATCWVSLALGGLEKSSAQFADGPQSEPLKRLANTVLDECEPFADQGIEASSLEDGLAKVSREELDADALSVFVQQVPTSTETTSGIYLSLHGCHAVARVYDSQQAVGAATTLDLDCSATVELASMLAGLPLADWPANFWADSYTDLSVQVLNHRRAFQAKRFAGLDREGGTPHQSSFDELIGSLEALHGRVMEEGTTESEPGPAG